MRGSWFTIWSLVLVSQGAGFRRSSDPGYPNLVAPVGASTISLHLGQLWGTIKTANSSSTIMTTECQQEARQHHAKVSILATLRLWVQPLTLLCADPTQQAGSQESKPLNSKPRKLL